MLLTCDAAVCMQTQRAVDLEQEVQDARGSLQQESQRADAAESCLEHDRDQAASEQRQAASKQRAEVDELLAQLRRLQDSGNAADSSAQVQADRCGQKIQYDHKGNAWDG